MKIFLGGGGSKQDSVDIDRAFANSVDKNKPLLYIPIAINVKAHSYESCLQYISSVFNPLGLENIVMWTEKNLKKVSEKDFNQFSGIYVGGGNTFKLLKNFREFGLTKIIPNLIRKGIPYAGGSAGAVIPCKTVVPAIGADPNSMGLKDLGAMNLVTGYDLFPHYTESQDEKIKSFMKKYSMKKVLAVPEDAGLMYDGKSFKVYGKLTCFLFENGNKTRLR